MPPHVAAGIAGFLGFVAVFLGLGGLAVAASAWIGGRPRPEQYPIREDFPVQVVSPVGDRPQPRTFDIPWADVRDFVLRTTGRHGGPPPEHPDFPGYYPSSITWKGLDPDPVTRDYRRAAVTVHYDKPAAVTPPEDPPGPAGA